jgi:peptidoglycan/LPS O-acetylase OafA/YrhL
MERRGLPLPAELSCFLLLFFLFDPGCAASRFFAWAPLRFVGIVSYEWFLFHEPVMPVFRNFYSNSHGSIWLYLLRTAVPIVLTFIFSVVVYRYFSFPLLQWGRGRQPARNEAVIPSVAAGTP